MTATPTAPATAPEYTAEATARLDRYLVEVRDALRGVPGVSADEVEADIRDHVATALRPTVAPVALHRLEPVLDALGPPTAWRPAVAGDGRFDWQAALTAFRHRLAESGGVLYRGPEDWRLAYLCLLFTALAVPTLGVGLVIAYILGRAAIELADERGQSLGVRRWLVYPAVTAVSLPALLAVLLLPLMILPAMHTVVGPAETYRAAVKSVNAEGTVTFRAGEGPSDSSYSGYRLRDAGITASGPGNRQTWRINEWNRSAYERTLAVMDALPVPAPLAGSALTAFAVVGGLLAWWLLLGVVRRAFPHAAATVFHPFVPLQARGVPVGLIACGLALMAWLSAARALLGA